MITCSGITIVGDAGGATGAGLTMIVAGGCGCGATTMGWRGMTMIGARGCGRVLQSWAGG